MRIAFDHQIFGWQKYGGVSRYIYELAKGLSTNSDHQVKILAPLCVNLYIAESPAGLDIAGINVPRLPRSGRAYRAINSLLVRPWLRKFNPAIVHETYYSGIRLAPRQAKVVVTVHDMIHERFSTMFSRTDTTSREKALAVRRADHVICVSENTRRDLVELFGVSESKTTVVHHGFSLTGPVAQSGESWVPPRRPYFLYVGNRSGYKNFIGLLQAYAQSKILKDNYDVLCFGGGRLTENERRKIAELGLNQNVVYQRFGSDALLARLYKSATAFVYPSMYEGFGIPPLEAMAFGCPVTCSNASSIPEVVGEAAEFFDPNDSQAMRYAMERVATDSDLRQTLIKNGRERLQLFSWSRCAEETLAIYERILL